jgi:hypothetical protein
MSRLAGTTHRASLLSALEWILELGGKENVGAIVSALDRSF